MSATATPPPIPGEVIDPTPKPAPERIKKLDESTSSVATTVGVGYRAFNRFSHAKASLLAAGTTYYLFLAMFAIIAFGYGVAATIGSEEVSQYLTEGIGKAFPGLLGSNGIDPAQLRAVGQATSVVGLVGLLYGGIGAVNAASESIHLIYGAPKDGRNFFFGKVRLLGWLAALGPLILLSYVASTFTSKLSDSVFEAIGVDWRGPTLLLRLVSWIVTLGVDMLIVYLALSHLGGIRPERRARLIGAGFGAILTELLKMLMSQLIAFTIAKPQYGALAAPIGILFVLYLQCLVLYLSASLTAGIAERDVPLVALETATAGQSGDRSAT